jgi:SSS family solute:Na+ symporter
MVVLIMIAFVITSKLTSILGAYKYITVIAGGLGTVMIARWYWWRVNTYSEIAAIVSSFIVGNFVAIKFAGTADKDLFAVRLVINMTITTICWVVVTFLTSKKPTSKAIEFYSKMRIAGPGWKAVSNITGVEPRKGEFKACFVAWITCVALLLSLLLAIGKFLFYEWAQGAACMVVFALSLVVLIKYVKKMSFD